MNSAENKELQKKLLKWKNCQPLFLSFFAEKVKEIWTWKNRFL